MGCLVWYHSGNKSTNVEIAVINSFNFTMQQDENFCNKMRFHLCCGGQFLLNYARIVSWRNFQMSWCNFYEVMEVVSKQKVRKGYSFSASLLSFRNDYKVFCSQVSYFFPNFPNWLQFIGSNRRSISENCHKILRHYVSEIITNFSPALKNHRTFQVCPIGNFTVENIMSRMLQITFSHP